MDRIEQKNSGFTLIEVLVSVLLLATGFLGVLALQSMSINYSNSAYFRTQATALAVNLIERMRVNPLGIEAGSYDAFQTGGVPLVANCLSGCTPLELAQMDLKEWSEVFDNAGHELLPDGVGSVTRNTDGSFTIRVSWQEKDRERGNSVLYAMRPAEVVINTGVIIPW